MTILTALFIPSRIWRLRFSVIAASLFDQNPVGLFSLIVDICLLYQPTPLVPLPGGDRGGCLPSTTRACTYIRYTGQPII